jgi:hypothetical protein
MPIRVLSQSSPGGGVTMLCPRCPSERNRPVLVLQAKVDLRIAIVTYDAHLQVAPDRR